MMIRRTPQPPQQIYSCHSPDYPGLKYPSFEDDYHRCLLVAHESPPTPRLQRLMAERCDDGPFEMHVVVSRFRRSVLVTDPALSRPGTRDVGADDRITVDDQAWELAEARLDSFMRALGGLNQPLTGEILGGNVMKGIRRVLRFNHFHEVVVLAPSRSSRWPKRDLAARVRRTAKLPVTLVAADDLAAT